MALDFLQAHWTLLTELASLFLLLVGIIAIAGVLVAKLDGIPVEDGIYFACITALTVGFGDLTPKSRGARAIAVLLAFVGLLVVGIVVAVSVHALDLVISGG